jgi:hypothetical protein
MESVFRMLLVVLLSVSAASAAQFSIQRAFERVKTLTGMCDGTAEKAAECASRAVARPLADLVRAGWELRAVTSHTSQAGPRISRGEIAETVEGFRKAYGHRVE